MLNSTKIRKLTLIDITELKLSEKKTFVIMKNDKNYNKLQNYSVFLMKHDKITILFNINDASFVYFFNNVK